MSEAAGWDCTGWGIDVVVVGHQHIYEDVLVDGLHHVTVGEGANGNERPCPVEAERVEGSQVCIDGPGAMLVTSTPASLTLEWRMPGDGADIVKDTIDLTRYAGHLPISVYPAQRSRGYQQRLIGIAAKRRGKLRPWRRRGQLVRVVASGPGDELRHPWRLLHEVTPRGCQKMRAG